MAGPRISVIVVAYDRTEFAREAIRSVLAQDCPSSEFETILLTNRSNPGVEQLCVANSIPRIEPPPGNWGEWVRAALPSCRGEILAFLDDDDLFDAGKLRAVRDAFAASPSLGYYHHRVVRFGSVERDRKAAGPTLGWIPDAGKTRPLADRLFWDLGGFNLSAIAVGRKLFEENADFLCDLRRGQSLAMFYAALAGAWDLYFDPRVLGRYRVHGRNQSVPAGTPLVREWPRAKEAAPAIIQDADRIAHYIDSHGKARLSSRPVRSVRARNRLLELLVEPGTSRSEVVRALGEFLELTPPRIAIDHRGLLGLSALGLVDPRLPDRWVAGRLKSASRT